MHSYLHLWWYWCAQAGIKSIVVPWHCMQLCRDAHLMQRTTTPACTAVHKLVTATSHARCRQ